MPAQSCAFFIIKRSKPLSFFMVKKRNLLTLLLGIIVIDALHGSHSLVKRKSWIKLLSYGDCKRRR